MAFKRYIYKHGKKLGPYYYENVRGPDGNVKTIYLGTNPSQHTHHKIKKPLFFLILVLILMMVLGSVLLFMQNKSYLFKSKAAEPDFDMDQILLKVLIKNREFIEKQLRVMYTGTESVSINVEASGLNDIIKIDSRDFMLKPGQTKVVTLNFSSFMPDQKIEQQPGIYVGKMAVKSQKAAREIPVVAEIETKNVLFDMNLNPVAIERRVKQGSETTIEVKLFNLESIESVNVDVEYFVKDMNGNTILTESETVVVKTQASFFKTISIPKNLKPGFYVFAGQVKLGNSVGTASYLFEVTGPEEAGFAEFCKNSILCLGLSLTTMLLVFALMAYLYFFIGAYLYEKIAGAMNAPRKRKEELAEKSDEEMASMFDTIREKAKKWTEGIGIKSHNDWEEKGPEQKKEGAGVAITGEPSSKSGEFYKLLDESKKALKDNNLPEANKLYSKARAWYGDLPNYEKSDAHGELMGLYNMINKSVEDSRKKEEKKIRKIESEKQLAEKRKQDELKKQKKSGERITILRKREQLEKKKAEEEGRKARELSEQKRREQQKLSEEKNARLEAGDKPVLEKEGITMPSHIGEFYDALNESSLAAKNGDASRLKELYHEARRIYEALPNQEKHEAYGKLIELHKLAKEQTEEQKKQKEDAENKAEQEKQLRMREQAERQKEPEKAKSEEAKQEKGSWLGSLFGGKLKAEPSEKDSAHAKEEKKEFQQQKGKESPERNKQKSEIDELEAAIKQLGMFRHVEKGKGIAESKQQQHREKKFSIFSGLFKTHAAQEQSKGDGGKLEKFHSILNKAKDAIKSNDIPKAKDFFSEARNCYLSLEPEIKDKAYAELMEVQDKMEKM